MPLFLPIATCSYLTLFEKTATCSYLPLLGHIATCSYLPLLGQTATCSWLHVAFCPFWGKQLYVAGFIQLFASKMENRYMQPEDTATLVFIFTLSPGKFRKFLYPVWGCFWIRVADCTTGVQLVKPGRMHHDEEHQDSEPTTLKQYSCR